MMNNNGASSDVSLKKNKAKQSFSNDREHGKLRTFLNTKAKQFLTTAWRLPDDCLTSDDVD